MKKVAVLIVLALLGLGTIGGCGSDETKEPVQVPQTPGRLPPKPPGQ